MRIKRSIRHWWQRRTRGWDDSELWGLDLTICQFVLPRLKAFRENLHSFPADLTSEQWENDILPRMIEGFQIVVDEEGYPYEPHKMKIVEKSLDLFREYFFHLWD